MPERAVESSEPVAPATVGKGGTGPRRTRRAARCTIRRPRGPQAGGPVGRRAGLPGRGGHQQLVVLAAAQGLLLGGPPATGTTSSTTPTPTKPARCLRSDARPSERSMAALAPDSRAASPSTSRATGGRWALINSAGSAGSERSAAAGGTGYAAAEQAQAGGRGPQRAGHEEAVAGPGPRPEQGRRSGSALRVPTTAVETTRTGDAERSPPTTTQLRVGGGRGQAGAQPVEVGAPAERPSRPGRSAAGPPWRPDRRRRPSAPCSRRRRGRPDRGRRGPLRPPGRWPK